VRGSSDCHAMKIGQVGPAYGLMARGRVPGAEASGFLRFSLGRSLRTKSVSCLGSPSHSMARVVTGSSGAFPGRPVKRTRNFSCSNLTGAPVAKRRAISPGYEARQRHGLPRQKYTCMYSVLPCG